MTETAGGDTQLTNTNTGADVFLVSGRRLRFNTAGSERARIDSSGNLLVGKTALNTNTAGLQLENDGYLSACRDGGNVVLVNRKSSDGALVTLQKDGTTVGSIGTEGNDIAFGNGDAGIQVLDGTRAVRPFNMTANSRSDNAVTLGTTNARWKDLYLSGGVYLGGTGAANKLEDYETGLFTPTVTGGVTSPVYATQSGSYAKIGDLVYFQFRIDLSTGTAASSQFKFGGLPFSSINNSYAYGGAFISYSAGFINNLGTVSLHISPNNNEILFYKPTDGAVMSGVEVEANGSVLANVYVNGVYRAA